MAAPPSCFVEHFLLDSLEDASQTLAETTEDGTRCDTRNPKQDHECKVECQLCGKGHPTGDKRCQARYRIPYLVKRRRWERARREEQVEYDNYVGKQRSPSTASRNESGSLTSQEQVTLQQSIKVKVEAPQFQAHQATTGQWQQQWHYRKPEHRTPHHRQLPLVSNAAWPKFSAVHNVEIGHTENQLVADSRMGKCRPLRKFILPADFHEQLLTKLPTAP
ncbi:hypothetical protein MTO96_022500 [Rhipicephalus appendiculatus]